MTTLRKIGSSTPPTNYERKEFEGDVVHTWSLNEKNVRLVRLGDKLEYELITPQKPLKKGSISIFPGKTIEDTIAYFKTLEPIVDNNNNDVKFVKKSKLDGYSIIDNENWAVTMADFGKRKWHLIKWEVYPVLFIETLKNSEYTIYMAFLSKEKLPKRHSVMRQIDEKEFNQIKFESKSVTWIRPKNLIQQMMSDIQNEKLLHQEREKISYNSIEWTKKTLESAKISSQFSVIQSIDLLESSSMVMTSVNSSIIQVGSKSITDYAFKAYKSNILMLVTISLGSS